MKRYELYAGQIVMVEAPKAGKSLAKVIKVNPKNVKILLADGSRWNMHPTFIKRAATPDEVKEFGDTLGAGSTEGASLTLGTAVMFKNNTGERKGVFVVIGSHGGTWRLARLGGDKGRYFRGIDSSEIQVVDFDLAVEGV